MTRLIRQGENLVTIARGEAPVIVFETKMTVPWIAAATANFLRSGCPAAQILLPEDFVRLGADHVRDCLEILKTELGILQLENERFLITPKPRVMFIQRIIDNGATQ